MKLFIPFFIFSLIFFSGCEKKNALEKVHQILHIYPNVADDDKPHVGVYKEEDIIDDILEDLSDIGQDIAIKIIEKKLGEK